MDYPRILTRQLTPVSRWMTLVEKTVQFTPDSAPETYHCLTQAAYVGVLVQLPDRRLAIVRQFRPAVEAYTWELPAGTLDPGDTPEQAAQREVLEETGITISDLVYLGNFHPDTGRIQVDSHAFFAKGAYPADGVTAEPGIAVAYVTHTELKRMIVAGEFRHQIHLSTYGAALARGIDLG